MRIYTRSSSSPAPAVLIRVSVVQDKDSKFNPLIVFSHSVNKNFGLALKVLFTLGFACLIACARAGFECWHWRSADKGEQTGFLSFSSLRRFATAGSNQRSRRIARETRLDSGLSLAFFAARTSRSCFLQWASYERVVAIVKNPKDFTLF